MIRIAPAAALLLLCSARVAAQVPTAARDLARGEVLAVEDIAYAGSADGAAAGMEETTGPVGWVTRRVVAAGEALRAPAIAPPNLVTAGETVDLLWRQGALELRVRGRALGSAAQGERVRVHLDAHRRLAGVAVAPRIVRVDTGDLRR